MDRQFLEFFGNFLINTAKGQKQVEDISKWMNQDFQGFDELTAMFKKFYGLDQMKENSITPMETWKAASENFQKSFKDYLRMMGVVPKDEQLDLVKKYEDLKEKMCTQEETIKHLRMILEEKKAESQGELVKGFQEVLEKQNNQFQETMETFGKFYKQEKEK